jgi:hypothetical protein
MKLRLLAGVLLACGLAWSQPVIFPAQTEDAAPVPAAAPPATWVIPVDVPLKWAQAPAKFVAPAHPDLKWERKGKEWWVTALRAGVVRVEWEGKSWQFDARPRAGLFPAAAVLKTFGGYSAARALEHWARDFLHRGAALEVQGLLLSARGKGLITVQTPVKMQVTDTEQPFVRADQLLLSNWPERVTEDQVLFEGALPAAAARVMVHHRNMPEQPLRWLDVELEPGAAGATYSISPHLVGPSTDEIFAGHLAATRFFDALTGERPQGYVVTVPPGGRHLVERSVFKPAQTVSGMFWIVSQGTPGVIRVTARQPENTEVAGLQPMESGARTARGVYPGEVRKDLKYTAGNAFLYEELGDKPYVKSVDGLLESPGSFGVVFRYRIQLENPSPEDREVRLEVSARGGPARATFFLDGTRMETGLLAAEPRLLKRWTLPAGTSVDAFLETFPQAGSNYPVHLVLSSRAAPPGASPATSAVENWRIP